MDSVDALGFESVPLNGMLNKIAEYKDAGKHTIMLDKSGNAGTFFSYKATYKEFHKEILKA